MSTYRVQTEAGLLAGTIIPSADGTTRAYGTKGQRIGTYATPTQAVEALLAR